MAEKVGSQIFCGYKNAAGKTTTLTKHNEDCLDCRKWAGAFHSAHLFVKTADIETNGPEPKTWTIKGEGGTDMERAFCNECGAGIWIRPAQSSDMTNLKAGLFAPKDIPNPTHENWMKNMESWETPARGTRVTSDANF